MYIRVERDTWLSKHLQQWLDAYNRRTDVMEASTDVAIQRRIDEITADLKASTDQLGQAVDEDKENK